MPRYDRCVLFENQTASKVIGLKPVQNHHFSVLKALRAGSDCKYVRYDVLITWYIQLMINEVQLDLQLEVTNGSFVCKALGPGYEC